MQRRERLSDFVEREWLGSWGSRREYGFCGSLLALSGGNARCDDFGRDARLEPVKVVGELALALEEHDPRSSNLGSSRRTSESAVTIAAAVASMFSGVH